MWWRALFIGCLAVALAEDAKDEAGLSKRQTPRGSTVIFGASPGQYVIQAADRANQQQQHQQQGPNDYQPQSELFVIRKPALAYSNDPARRPQYIQLSALQLQAAQQQQQAAYQQQQPQPQRQQPQAYDSLLSQSGQLGAGHGSFYRPAARLQPEQAAPVQFAAPGIVDSQAGSSFERELAQLVAANRAQEQKYNAAKKPAPQQYLKEITRPTARPVVPRLPIAPVQYQPIASAGPQAAPLYRFVYQHDQLQPLPQVVNNQQQYKQPQEQQYVRPHLQQYLQGQEARVRAEEDDGSDARSLPRLTGTIQQDATTPSRSSVYVSQSTPLKKQSYSTLAQLSERDEDENVKQSVPVVRIPIQRNRPLTQDEFQQILQSGGYTATLIPSDNPNSPHQEYLLHPVTDSPRPVYTNEKQEPVTYLLPQSQTQQRQIKRRPTYNLQQV